MGGSSGLLPPLALLVPPLALPRPLSLLLPPRLANGFELALTGGTEKGFPMSKSPLKAEDDVPALVLAADTGATDGALTGTGTVVAGTAAGAIFPQSLVCDTQISGEAALLAGPATVATGAAVVAAAADCEKTRLKEGTLTLPLGGEDALADGTEGC